MTQQQVWQWIVDHQILVWIAVSLVINFALRLRTVEGWIAFVEQYPRAASLIRLLRAIGVDPVKLTEAAIGVVTAKARIPSTFAASEAPTKPEIIPPPPRAPIITRKD